jgi:hypothetical protein
MRARLPLVRDSLLLQVIHPRPKKSDRQRKANEHALGKMKSLNYSAKEKCHPNR